LTSKPLIAHELTFGYQRGTAILTDFSRSFEPGTMTALTGVSGRGKSTLLYLMAGLLTPWSGTVSALGTDLFALDDAARARLRARQFGFVFQDVILDARRSVVDSVLEACLYAGEGRSAWRRRAMELLEELRVNVQPWSLPGEISGGQAQRVGLCRALLFGPKVIFADEPTGNLDNDSANAVLRVLSNAAEADSIVIIATHDDRVIQRCGEQVLL
jgi:ABC-type lipoprotein export system ATPase subunit